MLVMLSKPSLAGLSGMDTIRTHLAAAAPCRWAAKVSCSSCMHIVLVGAGRLVGLQPVSCLCPLHFSRTACALQRYVGHRSRWKAALVNLASVQWHLPCCLVRTPDSCAAVGESAGQETERKKVERCSSLFKWTAPVAQWCHAQLLQMDRWEENEQEKAERREERKAATAAAKAEQRAAKQAAKADDRR